MLGANIAGFVTVADAMLNQRTTLTLREEAYTWLTPYLFERSAWERAAAVMLLLRLLKEIRRSSRRVKGVRRVSVAYGGPRQRAQA